MIKSGSCPGAFLSGGTFGGGLIVGLRPVGVFGNGSSGIALVGPLSLSFSSGRFNEDAPLSGGMVSIGLDFSSSTSTDSPFAFFLSFFSGTASGVCFPLVKRDNFSSLVASLVPDS
ncbi:hypothetical protein MTO96_005735 [Rhipicephalus appendiculatus]